jgi:NAD+--asparagine ADP-ribosyltransferase
MDHEVLDCPRMITRLEKLNMEKGQETKIIEEPQKESEIMLLKIKETLDEHKDASLSEIFKEKEKIEVRIGDFDIDCALDEGT